MKAQNNYSSHNRVLYRTAASKASLLLEFCLITFASDQVIKWYEAFYIKASV